MKKQPKNDYYNLLNDSLRSGYLQVEKIYNRLIIMDPEKYVNIRTGYSMKYRSDDNDYVYSSGLYPLCWNSEKIGSEYDPITIERLLAKYEEWLTEYETNKDNNKIKKMIKEELESVKDEPDEGRDFMNYLKDIKEEHDTKYKYYTYFSEYEENESEDNSINSFIAGDDEVVDVKRKVFKKSLGRRKNSNPVININ